MNITFRPRELKKELQKQESIYKKYKAVYDHIALKDCPLARMALSRYSNAEEFINLHKKNYKSN